jgi:hypothetical protein
MENESGLDGCPEMHSVTGFSLGFEDNLIEEEDL